jgi:hypothetical protein
MKVTVQLDDALLKQSEEMAVRESTPLQALIEEGLNLVLMHREKLALRKRIPVKLPVCSQSGGVYSDVQLNDGSELNDLMEV